MQTNTGKLAATDDSKANALNDQFSSVLTETTFDSVPLSKPICDLMDNITITPKGVATLLAGLNTAKAVGPDRIHPRVLKELANELCHVLCHLFQQTMSSGIIPEDWKKANICPLYKKNERSLPSNYRPVSLTCICCKLLEHIVSSNLMKHFEANKILTDKQHAFRKSRSCETQLINVVNDWAKSLDMGLQIDSFVLDFEKAFDTVPHELLKSKLHKCGVSKQILN